MILEVADLIAQHGVVETSAARELSVAFIKTTDPTFLVFAERQSHPSYVVKVGRMSELVARQAVEVRLYDLMPQAIARPLGVYPLEADLGLLVQTGLPGRPWFRLIDRLGSTASWLHLRQQCIGHLRAFQAAVSSQPDWVAPAARFDVPLQALTTTLTDVVQPLGSSVQTFLRESVSALDMLGPVPATWQHGDFALNNLLIGDDRLGIVDLVDFGRWRVPMLDACALACSIHDQASTHVPWHDLPADVAACAAASPEAAAYTPRQKTAFFAYFLLAAVSDTLQRPNRATIRLTYLDHLRELAGDPQRYIRAFEHSA